jgi:hypothetical protein
MEKQVVRWFMMVTIVNLFLACAAQADSIRGADLVTVTVQADRPKNISPDLFGIFFEDINYAADGGLYAELIQNRSFE